MTARPHWGGRGAGRGGCGALRLRVSPQLRGLSKLRRWTAQGCLLGPGLQAGGSGRCSRVVPPCSINPGPPPSLLPALWPTRPRPGSLQTTLSPCTRSDSVHGAAAQRPPAPRPPGHLRQVFGPTGRPVWGIPALPQSDPLSLLHPQPQDTWFMGNPLGPFCASQIKCGEKKKYRVYFLPLRPSGLEPWRPLRPASAAPSLASGLVLSLPAPATLSPEPEPCRGSRDKASASYNPKQRLRSRRPGSSRDLLVHEQGAPLCPCRLVPAGAGGCRARLLPAPPAFCCCPTHVSPFRRSPNFAEFCRSPPLQVEPIVQ